MKRILIVAFMVFVCFTFSSTNTFGYQTKSNFSTDYKCKSYEQGGYSHVERGHRLTRFRNEYEFYITHITNIPFEAIISDIDSLSGEEKINESRQREIFEESFAKVTDNEGYIFEKNTYFLRMSNENPESIFTFIGRECDIRYHNSEFDLSCRNSKSLFYFNSKTNRFTYSYLGSWDQGLIDGYYGDSSVFAFGECEEYYR